MQGPFTQFLADHPEDREGFLCALDEAELFDFCSSQEEFSVLLKRDPKREFRKQPELQADVKMDEDERKELTQTIEERFSKYKEAFPQTTSADSLREHAREKTQPSVSVTINLNTMRQRADDIARGKVEPSG